MTTTATETSNGRALDPEQDQTTASLVKWFKIVAIAEAVSWGGLLLAMLFKYVISDTEAGVRLVGPIHGTMFLAYVALTIAVGVRLKWGAKIIIVGMAAAIPPFMTIVFERWADRSGHLASGTEAAG